MKTSPVDPPSAVAPTTLTLVRDERGRVVVGDGPSARYFSLNGSGQLQVGKGGDAKLTTETSNPSTHTIEGLSFTAHVAGGALSLTMQGRSLSQFRCPSGSCGRHFLADQHAPGSGFGRLYMPTTH